MEKDYYDILSARKKATKDEIKKAYHGASKREHPDVSGNNRQIVLNEAYEVLSDPLRRKKYDETGKDLNWEQQAVNIATKIIMEAIQKDPDDVAAFFDSQIIAGKDSINCNIRKCKEEKTKLRKFVERLTKAPDFDLVTSIINGRCNQIDLQIAGGEMLLKSMEKAEKILSEYVFEVRSKEKETIQQDVLGLSDIQQMSLVELRNYVIENMAG